MTIDIKGTVQFSASPPPTISGDTRIGFKETVQNTLEDIDPNRIRFQQTWIDAVFTLDRGQHQLPEDDIRALLALRLADIADDSRVALAIGPQIGMSYYWIDNERCCYHSYQILVNGQPLRVIVNDGGNAVEVDVEITLSYCVEPVWVDNPNPAPPDGSAPGG